MGRGFARGSGYLKGQEYWKEDEPEGFKGECQVAK